jgi:phosphonate transport system ATP-binding protein
VAIARALMQKAQIILADEPIASLDPESARIVMETLRDINQNDGITVVVTLHQVDYALRYCERIVALRQGHVFFDGASHQFDNERFDHLYRSINRVEENAQAA